VKNTLRGLLIGTTLAVCAVTAAQAEVLRLAIVIAPDQAGCESNVTMTSTFEDLYKKAGATSCTVGHDATHLAIASSCVFANEAAIAAVTGSPEWAAANAKLKIQTRIIELLQTGQ